MELKGRCSIRITTHGKNRGKIELVTHELRTLKRASELLNDLQKYGGWEVSDLADETQKKLDKLISQLTEEAPKTVDS